MRSARWRIRSWSIRAKIVTLVLPPLVSLVVLWIFATSLTAGSALRLLDTKTNADLAGKPAQDVVIELQRERTLSMVYLGAGRPQGRPETKALTDQRPNTDKAIAEFRRLALSEDMQDIATDETKRRIEDILDGLDGLAAGRPGIDLGQVDRAGTMQLYNEPIDAIYRMYASLPSLDEAGVSRQARSVIAMSRARELLAREDSLLSGAAAAGRFIRNEHTELIQAIGAQRVMYAEASAELPPGDLDTYQDIQRGESYTQLRILEDRIIVDAKANLPVPVDMTAWRTAYDKTVEQLRTLEYQAGDGIIARSTPIGVRMFVRLGVAGVLGLLAVVVSVVLSVRIGRSLIRRLTGLRQDAQDLADKRLPALVGRLREGEDVDVKAAAPPLEYGADEIGNVGHAFSAVQRTAVESAVQEAKLRRGLNEVFLNIARRSQTLLHRQLALLDRMERRSTDPEELEDLFRIDHLATRMRRHAEDLVILAGATPGRGWRNPVPMVDVIRGAVSEVEDYARVGFGLLPDAALIGRAVADVIHLLAEVIENATAYSPPHTQVQISGQLVPNGYAVEIEDRGLGMSPEAIDEANQRLLHPPDFDPANSAQLGLFVVALLAARHGVRVTLRASPYGGVTAVVLIPPHLISGAPAELTVATPAEQAQAFDPSLLELDLVDVVRPAMAEAASRPRAPKHRAALEASARAPSPAPAQAPAPGPAPTPPPAPAPAPTPAAAAPVAAPAPAAASAAAPAPASAAASAPAAVATAPRPDPVELTDDGLPRRQRQANLAPQLREPGDDDPTVDGVPALTTESRPSRSPEQVRDLMTSYQVGFTKGRRDASTLDETGAAPAEKDG